MKLAMQYHPDRNQSADAAESQDTSEPREGNAEPHAREIATPSEPEITIPNNPLPVEPD